MAQSSAIAPTSQDAPLRSWSAIPKARRSDRFVGKKKHTHFDFLIEIYDPEGNCETVIEITAPLTSQAEAEFFYTVDKLADSISIPCSGECESNLFIDSLTFENNLVTESLVSDVTSKDDSLTFENNLVTESLVSNVTSENDSLTSINIYKAKGTARGERKYFRYTYKEAGKVRHLHIGSGNIHSVVAQSRMQLVRDAILKGQSPNEIKQLIRGFRN